MFRFFNILPAPLQMCVRSICIHPVPDVTEDEKRAKIQSSNIERDLFEQAKLEVNVIKLLLLGAAESGKSTMVKQMKIIHSHGFSKPELISFKAAVLDNLLTSMKFVLRGMVLLRINLANKKNKAHARSVLSCGQCFGEDGELLPFVALSFCALWADQGVRAAAARGYEFQLNDSALYFFENINRIISPRYIPPEADVLRVRVRTSGIIETRFPVNHMVFRSRLGRGCCRTSHHCHVCGLQQDPQQACLPPLHHCHGHPQRTGGLPRRHGHRRQGELGELLIAISPDQGTFDCISALDTF